METVPTLRFPFHSWGVKTASGLAKLSVAVLDAENVRHVTGKKVAPHDIASGELIAHLWSNDRSSSTEPQIKECVFLHFAFAIATIRALTARM